MSFQHKHQDLSSFSKVFFSVGVSTRGRSSRYWLIVGEPVGTSYNPFVPKRGKATTRHLRRNRLKLLSGRRSKVQILHQIYFTRNIESDLGGGVLTESNYNVLAFFCFVKFQIFLWRFSQIPNFTLRRRMLMINTTTSFHQLKNMWNLAQILTDFDKSVRS